MHEARRMKLNSLINTIVDIDTSWLHTGKYKTFIAMNENYYGISDEV